MPTEMPVDHRVPSTPEKQGFYGRFHRWLLIGLLLLAPGYLWVAKIVLTPGDMSAYLLDVAHWLPPHSRLIQDMEKFSEVAGKERGNVIRISWDGCVEGDGRSQEFARSLREKTWPDNFSASNAEHRIFDEVLTVSDIKAKARSSKIKLPTEQIDAQLQNVLVGSDGTTCVMATLSSRDPVLRSYAMQTIFDSADEVSNLKASDLRMFGGPVYTSQIDKMGLSIAAKFTPISIGISILCAWLCLRNGLLMLAVFLNALIGTCFALVSMYLTDVQMDPLLMLIPGFWFIMSISGGLHFVNYYYEEREKHGDGVDLSSAAARTAFRPTFLATLTTCIGLGSLCTSEIMPMWRFGFHAAVGLAFSFVGLFLFLPSFLKLISKNLGQQKPQSTGRFWSWYENFVLKFGPKTALLCVGLIIVGAIGISKLGFSNKLRDQFALKTKINTDTVWFEEHIGPVIPIEVLVRFDKEDLPRPSDRLDFINSLQNRINDLNLPNKTLSATAVVPYTAGRGGRQAAFRAVLDRKINRHLPALSKMGYVVDEPEHQLWRLTVFVYNSVDNTMTEYFRQIQKTVAQQKNETSSLNSEVSFGYAGLGARMAVITGKLGGELMQSCYVSALLISSVVIIALRSLVLGLVAMIPNVFPIMMSFGTYGHFQSTLDIGSIMTASIAMGIAVDDTIHFMYWFRSGTRSGKSVPQAIRLSIKKCGRAIVATSMICGFGFLVYFFCDFMPVARFGQLLFLMLTAALVGDLFFLPALLQSLPVKFLPDLLPKQIPTVAKGLEAQ